MQATEALERGAAEPGATQQPEGAPQPEAPHGSSAPAPAASLTPSSEVRVAPKKGPAERLANVERLRIIAMLEIVTFHVGGAVGAEEYRLPIVGGLGLPVFLLLNNAFNCTLVERRGTRAFLDAKVSRLLVPWLAWSVVYAGVVAAERLRHAEPVLEAFLSWRTLLGGTYTHLWFVPFALFGSVLIAAAQERTKARSHRSMASASLVLGALLVLGGALVLSRSRSEWPIVQWLFALPSPLLGFGLGRVLLAGEGRYRRRVAVLLAVVAAVAVAACWGVAGAEMVRRYALSMALVGVFFTWPGALDGLSRRLTPLLFGIYLTHPLVLRLYQAAHLPAVQPALLGIALFLAAAALVELLRRTPLRSLV